MTEIPKPSRKNSRSSSSGKSRSSTGLCSEIVAEELHIDEQKVVDYVVKSSLDSNKQPVISRDVFKNLNKDCLAETLVNFMKNRIISKPKIRYQENFMERIDSEFSRLKKNVDNIIRSPQLDLPKKDDTYLERQRELNKNNPAFLKILDFEFEKPKQRIINQFEVINAYEEYLFSTKNNNIVDLIGIGTDDILQHFVETDEGDEEFAKTIVTHKSYIRQMLDHVSELNSERLYLNLVGYDKNYTNLMWAYVYKSLNVKRILYISGKINALAPFVIQDDIEYYVTNDKDVKAANLYKALFNHFVSKKNQHKFIQMTGKLPIRTQSFDTLSLVGDDTEVDTFWNNLEDGGKILWYGVSKHRLLDFYKKHRNAHPGKHFSIKSTYIDHKTGHHMTGAEVLWVIVKQKTNRPEIKPGTPFTNLEVYNSQVKKSEIDAFQFKIKNKK
jgi:hypothetical protein